MEKPALPSGEADRQAALCALNLLDTPPEARFDRITRIAQRHFGVRIALVSLVDAGRQWFKSRQGLDATETPRDVSFCGHAILSSDIFYIPDAHADPRFADNPLVTGPPHVRFYAGAPLRAPGGERVGTLCIIDSAPRVLSPEDQSVLRDLADGVEAEMERTELRVSERQLRSAENRLRAIIETVVDGIVTIDSDGFVQTFNPAAERIFGYAAVEVIGRTFRLLMPYADRHALDAYLHSRPGSEHRADTSSEVTGLRRDGSTFPMEVAVSEMEINGERWFTGIVRDISDRKKVERLKSEFVSTVSHELRTPLTSIRGALGLLRGKHAAALPEKGRHLLEMANRNAERLTLLINDILDLEKIESGSLDFDFKPLDLAALAGQALAANEGYAHQHGVVLRHGDMPEGAALVRADEHRLMQVFGNLLSNAIKYSPPDGEVVLSVARRDSRLRVTVKDHGRGIPAEFRSRIFQRFAQADSSDTREKGGTGLGLSVTKAIVERHEGTIDYLSEPELGTEFFFELPAWQETTLGEAGRPGQPLLLVCEDNSDVARVLGELLAGEGIASDIAATAAGAKSLLAQRSYQALVLDLSLPDQDGLELLKELRAKEETRDLPIVVVSGRANEGRAAWQGDALAVVDWLQKPVDTARLSRAVRQALAGRARPRVLHVEDDLDIVQMTEALVDGDVAYEHVATLAGARRLLAAERYDLVLLDLALPDGSGVDLLAELKGKVPVVVFSGQEPDRQLSGQVAAALVKSRTSNEQLLETIRRAVRRGGRRKND